MLWLVLGIIIGGALYFLIRGAKAGKFQIAWYQWVLGGISTAMILFALQNFLGFQRELEPQAGIFVLMVVGLPAVVLAALIWVIPLIIKNVKGSGSSKGISA